MDLDRRDSLRVCKAKATHERSKDTTLNREHVVPKALIKSRGWHSGWRD